MKKYIVSILIASVFLISAPIAVKQVSAVDINIRDFINLLITIGVIAPDKIPAVNAYLATFSNSEPISTTPSITVISPNGGENLISGITHNITWSSTGSISNVTIALQTISTAGNSLSIIANEITNSGSYTWLVPSFSLNNQYKIEIYPATGRELVDRSDNPFTISSSLNNDGQYYPILNLLTPTVNGNTVTQNGVTYPVTGQIDTTWCKTTNPNASGSGPFEFNWNDGSKSCSWFPATHTYAAGYQWGQSGMYKITVRVKNTSGRISSRDQNVAISSSPTPAPSITVISPNGGQTFAGGANLNIKWNVVGPENFIGTKLMLLDLNGTVISDLNGPVVTEVSIGNSVSGQNISNALGTGPGFNGKYLVKVCLIGTSVATTLCDAGDNYITINPVSTPVSNPIYPVCGAASNVISNEMPTSNLCSVGTVASQSGPTGDGLKWVWGCVGSNTGWPNDTAWCFAPKKNISIYPACGSASNVTRATMPTSNLCSVGTLATRSGTTEDGTNRWYWGCVGQNTGWAEDTAWCFAPKSTLVPVYPACGSAANTASAVLPTSNLCSIGIIGSSKGETEDGTNRWFWGCVGQNTGWPNDTAWCFAPKITVSAEGQNYASAAVSREAILNLIQALR